MSDRLVKDFDIYYKELENFTGHFKTSSQTVETDKLLSRAGKHEKIAVLKASHDKNVNDLSERFNSDFQNRVENIDNQLSGAKSDLFLNSIQKRFSKGENISSEETSRLLLHEMGESKTLIRKSNFQNMMATADEKQIKKTSQTLVDKKDTEKLNWLQELTDLRGEQPLSSLIQAQLDGVRDSQLSDEQKQLQTVSEKISKGVKLFEYSIERSKRGDFIDARQDELQ